MCKLIFRVGVIVKWVKIYKVRRILGVRYKFNGEYFCDRIKKGIIIDCFE